MKEKLKPASYETAIIGMFIMYWWGEMREIIDVAWWLSLLVNIVIVGFVILRMRQIEGHTNFVRPWYLVVTVLLLMVVLSYLFFGNK